MFFFRQEVQWQFFEDLNACAGPLAPLAMTHRMHWRERLQRTLDLWPYMAPLTLVYFAEYVLQVLILRRHI